MFYKSSKGRKKRMKRTVFIKNTAILTVTGIVLRIMGMVFRVFLASRIGSEGIGLYTLIFSVYILASAFASSGITTAVTRLCSEELVMGNRDGIKKIMTASVTVTLLFSAFSFVTVFFGSDIIAERYISDLRSAPSLKILCFALPFVAVSSCIKGYFVSRRKVTVNSSVSIGEQLVRIAFALYFILKFSECPAEKICSFIILADVIAEAVSCFCLYLVYMSDVKNICRGEKIYVSHPKKKILKIALPLMSGRYLTSAFRTTENMIVPLMLSRFNGSYPLSLSFFGAVKGMAVPLLFFPSALLSSVSALLIPEMSEALVKKRPYVIRSGVKKCLTATFLLGTLAGALFFFVGKDAGILVYSDENAGDIIRKLSFIVPFMYVDSLCDGLLKGLGEEKATLKIAVTDSAVRIALILLLLPRLGENGFIYIMYVSNLLTCALSVIRLVKVTKVKMKAFFEIILPFVSAVCFALAYSKIFSFVSLPIIRITAVALFTSVSFILYLTAFKIVDINDYRLR